jgi:uncharacterized protein (DUF433 family)
MPAPIISVDPDVLDGQPCFAGTRTPVDVLFANLAAGERLDVILEHYPGVTREAAVDVLQEACRLVRQSAMEEAGLAPEIQEKLGALMYPADWAGLSIDEKRAHYGRRAR